MSALTEQVREIRVVRWEEPPAPCASQAKARYDLAALGRELAARPGEWAVVLESRHQAVAHRVAQMVKVRLGGRGRMETVTRQVGDEYRAYARWVPGVAR